MVAPTVDRRLGVTGAVSFRLAVVDAFRMAQDRGGERLAQISARTWQASIGFAVRARGESVRAEHHLRMLDEILVDADRAFVFGRTANPCEVEPGIASGGLSFKALAEEQDVDDDVCAGISPEAALW